MPGLFPILAAEVAGFDYSAVSSVESSGGGYGCRRARLSRGALMYSKPQKFFAEFVGTFALIFFGAGSICADQLLKSTNQGSLGLLGIAVAHGLAIGIMVSAVGHISGGHLNPAVTIGFWVTRRISTFGALLYWVSQLAGAVAAAYLLRAVIPEDTWRAIALGTPD